MTDNEDLTPDEPITLTAAGDYAKQYDIAIYGMSTAWDENQTQEQIDEVGGDVDAVSGLGKYAKEFRKVTFGTGGAYYVFRDVYYNREKVVNSADKIVDQVLAQAAARYEGTETLIERDVPLIPTILAILCFAGYFILTWRLGL